MNMHDYANLKLPHVLLPFQVNNFLPFPGYTTLLETLSKRQLQGLKICISPQAVNINDSVREHLISANCKKKNVFIFL